MARILYEHHENTTRALTEADLATRELGYTDEAGRQELIFMTNAGSYRHFASLERMDDAASAAGSGAKLVGYYPSAGLVSVTVQDVIDEMWTAVASRVTGSGTLRFLPIWTSSTVLGDSIISQDIAVAEAKVICATLSTTTTLTVGTASATGTAESVLKLTGGSASTGDVYMQYIISGATTYTMGADNSVAGNPFTLSFGTVLGTTNVFTADGTTFTVVDNATFNGLVRATASGGGAASTAILVTAATPAMGWNETDVAVDAKQWDMYISAGVWHFRTVNDANSFARDIITVTRDIGGGTPYKINDISHGNTSDNNTNTWLGTGVSTFGGDVTSSRSSVGGTVLITVSNTDNTAASASNAKLLLSVGGSTTTGDPFVGFNVSGVTSWVCGIDNSGSGDPFVLSASATPGTSNRLVISTAGAIGVGGLNPDPSAYIAAGSGDTTVSGVTQRGIWFIPRFTAGATSNARVLDLGAVWTDASVFTTINASAINIADAVKGSSQTITNSYGIVIANITAGGTLNYAISTGTGLVHFGDSLDVTKSSSGVAVISTISNTYNSTGTQSDALLQLTVGGTTSIGDPMISFTVTGASTWSIGVDNSDGDTFKISKSAALATTTYMRTTGIDWFWQTASVTMNLGTDTTNLVSATGTHSLNIYDNRGNVDGIAIGTANASAANTGVDLSFGRARGSVGSEADVTNGDRIFRISGYARSTTLQQSAFCAVEVDGVVTAGQAPASRWIFHTNANNSATAEALRINADGTSLFSFGVKSTSYFNAASGTGTTAGGSTIGFMLGTSPGLIGVYWGSGAPTITAPKGSFYMRTNGSGTTDRAYINTDGGTTWTALTTVA